MPKKVGDRRGRIGRAAPAFALARHLAVYQRCRREAPTDSATELRGAHGPDPALRVRRPGVGAAKLPAGGTFVLVGAAKGGMLAIAARLLGVLARARIARQRTVWFIARVRSADLAALAALIESGQLSPVVDRAYPLGDAAEAMRYAESGQARAKVVVSVS